MLIYPHRIRLRAPWECTVLSPATEHAGPRRVDVPSRLADLGLSGFRGRVLLRRKFGYPGRIDAHERVWLTFGAIAGLADVALNNEQLGRGLQGTVALDVTPYLRPHNVLEVTLAADSDQAGLAGEVALEIRCLAYLEHVALERKPDGTVCVAGRVGGVGMDPLEIYVLVDRRQAAYQVARVGERFELPLPPTGKIVRVELVNVSVVWYFVELPLG